MAKAGTPVRIEVAEIQGGGSCPLGLEVGRTWVVDSGMVPEGMCGSAYHSIFPYLTALRFGADLPWEEVPGTGSLCCPDPANPVVFRLTRAQGSQR